MSDKTAKLRQFQLVRFNHERAGGPVHRVVSVMDDGMVELHDMPGYFAPHLFSVADDIADMPPQVTEAEAEADGTEWAAFECAAMELWVRDPNADDELWSELGDSIRNEYRETARAVIEIYLETMDGN